MADRYPLVMEAKCIRRGSLRCSKTAANSGRNYHA